MRKRKPLPKLQDHLPGAVYRCERNAQSPSATAFYADPLPPRSRRQVSYTLDATPKKETVDIPRLFIQGFGGSIKLDLLGVGIRLSAAAFAHWVPDESLAAFDIHRGDIAIIDPKRRMLRVGNLVLVELNGRGTLRRLVLINRVWYLEAPEGSGEAAKPVIDLPLSGVVMGITRLFTRLQPVRYRGTGANFLNDVEQSRYADVVSTVPRRIAAASKSSKREPAKRRKSPFLLAAERSSPHAMTEKEKLSPYSPRAKRR